MHFTMSRRSFLQTAAMAPALSLFGQTRSPNVVLIYADDLGYGDLGCYGSRIPTPNLNQMAEEGLRFTQFYSAASVCSPARAALLTGRYATRVDVPRVLDPNSEGGLPESETTIAQMLKGSGYATACVGKWHLGSQPDFMPTRRGFDEFFGIPYSHDMWPRPLMHNDVVLEKPAQVATLTQRYTEFAVDFISQAKDSPFFLYMPHTAPHIPLAASPGFAGTSGQGVYGDSVKEIDWSVGRVLQALKDNNLDENTLVMFTSDNGPWFQGSAGRLRGRKGDNYEGGFRVPFLARMPGRIPAGKVIQSMGTALDILPTVAGLTEAALPSRPLDGVDLMPVLSGQETQVNREVFLYFNDIYLQCARLGSWKLHMARYNSPMFVPEPPRGRANLPLPRPELYNVAEDQEEAYDRYPLNRQVASEILERVERLIAGFPPAVVNAYNETKRCRVEETPVNAPPVQTP
jgi:arylsulfatase A